MPTTSCWLQSVSFRLCLDLYIGGAGSAGGDEQPLNSRGICMVFVKIPDRD